LVLVVWGHPRFWGHFCILFYFLFLQDRVYYVTQAGFECSILLPLLPKCWNYSCAPPHLAILNALLPGEAAGRAHPFLPYLTLKQHGMGSRVAKGVSREANRKIQKR
jgi:hypothetical protein